MILTDNDYEVLAAQITEGEDYAQLDSGNETLELRFSYEEDSYQEDDYHCGYGNGTGAWVTTGINLYIKDVECYNEDGEKCEHDFDECKLYQLLRDERID